MGEKVFVAELVSGDVFVARVDLYIDVVGGILGGCGGDVYCLNNPLWLQVGVRMGEDACEA